MRNFTDDTIKNTVEQIKYRESINNGEIKTDNGNGTYGVEISQSGKTYPNVPTANYGDTFAVGEIAIITYEYGNKEMPRIWGHAKKIAQNPVEVEVDNSGSGGDPITTVTTLDPYSVTTNSAYVEGKIGLSNGAGNCTRRGFHYGLTIAYGSDIHEDGDYGEGYFNKQITGLTPEETYHYQAYVTDVNGDEQVGEDKSFQAAIPNLISCDDDTDTIYKHSGITSTILDSFASPATGVNGLTYDGNNLISCDDDTDIFYKHSGVTSTILDSFSSPANWPGGLAYDGNNLISDSSWTETIYKHSGITSTILDSFASPDAFPTGLTYDGNNLISCDDCFGIIYKHSGVTSTILDSFSSPANWPRGLACSN